MTCLGPCGRGEHLTACASKLAGPGEREAAIRSPVEMLLGAAGKQLGVMAVFHDEVRDTERQVRPGTPA